MRAIASARHSIGAVLALALLLMTAGGTAKAQFLFNDFNIYIVFNKPTHPTQFYVDGLGWQVTAIADYHYNNGLGPPSPVSISLLESNGKVIGPFPQSSEQNLAVINNVNMFLKPGWYTVQDSDPDTWSQNAASGGRGFTRVFGTARGQHVHRAPTPSSFVPPNFVPCGNLLPSFSVEMGPCIGTSSTTITIVVVHRALAAPVSSVTFRLDNRRFGVFPALALPVSAPVTGSGTAVGSVYTVNAPSQLEQLCIAGQYSVWGVLAYDARGISLGEMGQFTIEGCP